MGGGVHDSYTFQCGLVEYFTSPGIDTSSRVSRGVFWLPGNPPPGLDFFLNQGVTPFTGTNFHQSLKFSTFGSDQEVTGALCHSFDLEYLDKQSSVMSGPRKIRSRGSWSHIVSKARDA